MHESTEDRPDRRRNLDLRSRLDELVELARSLSRRGTLMTERELREVEERIEWLAEEIWRAALDPLDVRRDIDGSREEESET